MKTMPLTPEVVTRLATSLSRCFIFQGMDQSLLKEIAGKANLVQLESGEFLTREGKPAEAFYVFLNGNATVMVQQNDGSREVNIAKLGPGDTAGEIGLLLAQPYSASVKATSRIVAARYDPQFFETMVAKIPSFGLMLAKSIGRHLAQSNRRIPVPEYNVEEGAPSEQAFKLLPIDFIKRHRVLPIKQDGNNLTIGLVDEPSSAVLESIRNLLTGMELRPVRIDSALFEAMMHTHSGALGKGNGQSDPTEEEFSGISDAPSMERLLQAMIAEGASDLHLSAGQRPRWRIDGHLTEIVDMPALDSDSVMNLLKPLLEQRHEVQFRETSDADFAYTLPAAGGRFRVNLFRNSRGTSAVFRHIPARIPTLEQLNMPEVITRFCNEPKGLILVTGPTGSGKSTTLAAMVDYINKNRKEHILTLEDPIEFVHESRLALINQREVGSHTQSFSRALRAALREDPDVVLVGEMRDLETVSLALETANTGHLVLATLHTSTAAMTIDRIVNLFPPEQQNQIRSSLADVLRGVICQNLCRRIGGGRIAALEILVVNHGVAGLIREGKTVQIGNMMQTGKAAGNQLLNDSLLQLVQSQKIEADEALSKSVDKTELARRLKRPLQ
jgi:twitching motility protein PilT